MTMELINLLLAIDDELVEWIIGSSGTSDAERAQMREVLLLRGKLDRAINRLMARRLKLAAANIAQAGQRLAKLNEEMKQTAKNVARAEHVIGIVGKVLEVVAQVITALA
jgi:hypothetical protein